MTDTTWLDEVLEEVAKGARLDGFHAKDLIAYPHQSDRYLKPAKATILTKLEEAVDNKMAEFMLKKGVKYDVKASDKVILITPTKLNTNKE